ncbi:Protein CBG01627 [Caenorhabditis briggsae]|uniref:Uncharacterized protein n=2 Tax=Caenorhabditis briggsae TaxID=6238 RepID=A0AAE9AD51_CAEBR|nr:Protein CBG01627 [Caenorhabditis briggsae]ULT96544.1 hypothetical protein L3Y34_004843 [Caenorhabditis briggsae]UMM29730.1 hypothetical protein L5515_011943 [Caenorhabditis briggsae]CAP22986.1 Protein CBG01627 [Caenorhabditis briggsae]
MHSATLLALLALAAGASAQCFGGGCGGPIFLPPPPCFGGNCGCSGNNCGPQVTVVQVPNNNNGCSCSPCSGPICAPMCNSCPPPPPIFIQRSSCCNQNNFSCCPFRFRRHNTAAETIEEATTAAPTQE